MRGHIMALGIAFIIGGTLLTLLSLVVGVFALLGGAGMLTEGPQRDPADPIIGGCIGFFIAFPLLVAGVLEIVAGTGTVLLRRWAWTAGMAAAIVNLMGLCAFPISTGIGIYGLWVLLHEKARSVFGEGD